MELHTFDETYLRLLREGDRSTQKNFVDYFTRLLRVKLRSRRIPADVVEDIRQEALLRVLTAIRDAEIRSPERIGLYVDSVCNNVILEHYRAKGLVSLQATELPSGDDILLEISSPDFTIAFASGLSPEQIKGTLEALAKYYRSCGGVGLETQFELEEARVPELAHA